MAEKHQDGFTLIEVVVASTILALLMTGLYQFMAVGYSVWERGQKEIDEQQNVRLAVSQISREIRTAHCWDIGTAGPSGFPKNTIEIKVPQPENMGDYRSISYYLSGGNILRDVNGSGHNVLSYGIKKVEFTGDNCANTITITIEGQSGFTITTKAFMRVDRSFLFIR